MATTTVDLRRELAEGYSAAETPALVQAPELQFLMIDGHGDPNTSPDYAVAVAALYAVAYTIRFALTRGPAAGGAVVDAGHEHLLRRGQGELELDHDDRPAPAGGAGRRR